MGSQITQPGLAQKPCVAPGTFKVQREHLGIAFAVTHLATSGETMCTLQFTGRQWEFRFKSKASAQGHHFAAISYDSCSHFNFSPF